MYACLRDCVYVCMCLCVRAGSCSLKLLNTDPSERRSKLDVLSRAFYLARGGGGQRRVEALGNCLDLCARHSSPRVSDSTVCTLYSLSTGARISFFTSSRSNPASSSALLFRVRSISLSLAFCLAVSLSWELGICGLPGAPLECQAQKNK